MRAIGVGVEEQVGGGIARDVGLHVDPRGEDQPRRIDAGGMGFAAQIVLRLDAGLEQPQHASGHRGEQAHPQREHVGQDLVGVVEATEHEAGLGQAAGGTRWRRSRRQARGVAGEGHVRHVQRPLTVERRQMLGQAEAVGEDVVVPGRAERSRITDAIDLQRGRTQGEDALRARSGYSRCDR